MARPLSRWAPQTEGLRSGMGYVIKSALLSLLMRQHGSMIMAKTGSRDLEVLKELIEDGKISPVRVTNFGCGENTI